MTLQSIFDLPATAQTPRPEIHQLWQAFDPLPFDLRRRALRFGDLVHTTPGATFTPEQDIAVVVSGCLILQVGETDLCADVATTGALVDLHGGTRGRWLTEGTLYKITFRDFVGETGEVGVRFLLEAAAERVRARDRRIVCTAAHSALQRTASMIAELGSACQSPDIRIKQAELGTMLCLQRSSVNMACQKLTRIGAIRTIRSRVNIIDQAKLALIACNSPSQPYVEASVGEVGLGRRSAAFAAL